MRYDPINPLFKVSSLPIKEKGIVDLREGEVLVLKGGRRRRFWSNINIMCDFSL